MATPSEINAIRGLFIRKGWSIKDKGLDTFITTYDLLRTNEEKSLFMNLAERFLYIPLSKYTNEIITAVEMLLNDVDRQEILIYCGLQECEYGKVKSNYIIAYIFKGLSIKRNLDFKDRRVQVINTFEELISITNLESTALVLVDDFIGSGETMENAFFEIREKIVSKSKPLPLFAVLSIVAMNDAVKRLARSDIKIYSTHVLSKAISDYYSETDLKEAIQTMTGIEKRIKRLSNTFKFGYNKTEALVCMERCPNNTLPIFWKGKGAVYER